MDGRKLVAAPTNYELFQKIRCVEEKLDQLIELLKPAAVRYEVKAGPEQAKRRAG